MTKEPATLIPEDLPLGEVIKTVGDSTHAYFPVVNQEGRLTGILSLTDIKEAVFQNGLQVPVLAKDVAIHHVDRVSMDDSLEEALNKMGKLQVDELPVVRTESPDEVQGMISKRDIITYYHAQTEADQD